MCAECNQYHCATTCPNGEPMVDEITIECALCERDVDEAETRYGICEDCWTKYSNYDNAIAYGAENRATVTVNGLYAKILTPDQIESALAFAVRDMKNFYYDFTIKTAMEFLLEDDGDYADWLKRQANDQV